MNASGLVFRGFYIILTDDAPRRMAGAFSVTEEEKR